MQQVTTLISIAPEGRSSRPAARSFFQAARRVRQLPGFCRWQTFRALDSSDELILVLDWDPQSWSTATLAELEKLVQQARRLGLELGPIQTVEPSFDRCLLRERPVATLLRLSRTRPSLSRDSEYALKALAAPGTTRLYGGQTAERTAGICRIDFDAEDGIWHFLESPLREAWSRDGALQRETWALNLPRLEWGNPASQAAEDESLSACPAEPGLSVQFSVSDDRESAQIRLQGQVDARGCELTERFCNALIEEGCLQLDVDVCDLTGISAETLLMLARTARALKARGGRFKLLDNADRVRRITRTKQLESAVR